MDATTLLSDPGLYVIGGIAVAAWWNLSARMDSQAARIDTLFDHFDIPHPKKGGR